MACWTSNFQHEYYWIKTLCTVYPYGLQERTKFQNRVQKQITFNSPNTCEFPLRLNIRVIMLRFRIWI